MNTTEFIRQVKLNSFVPIDQRTLTDADILSFADRELELNVIPSLLEFREEYLVSEILVPMTTDKISYSIPYRAINQRLRNVFYVDSDKSQGLREMTRIGYDQRTDFTAGISGGTPYRFFIRGSEVVLGDGTSQNFTGSLLFSYYLKPGRLVLSERIGFPNFIQVGTDINGAADPLKTTVTLTTAAPENLTMGKIDFMEGRNPFNTFSYDITPTTVSGNKMEFNASDIPAGFNLETGYIASAWESYYPQIPEDLHTLLIEETSKRVQKAMGDLQGYQIAKAENKEYRDNMMELTANRVESSPMKIVNRRGTLGRRWGRRF